MVQVSTGNIEEALCKVYVHLTTKLDTGNQYKILKSGLQ